MQSHPYHPYHPPFDYYNIMSQLQQFQSDKVLTRTLFNNFGTLLVFAFHSQHQPKSQHLRENLESTIPIFGNHDNVKYFSIDVEACPETAKKFEVADAPVVLFTQTDKKVRRRFSTQDVGLVFDTLQEEILVFRAQFQEDKKVWHPKIKSILDQSQVVVFIKGTADAPKCGFTETLLSILEKQDVSFTFYDILADQYMRYWLRNYCGWPTYPQVHVNGKIVGGLDVCKDLVAKGGFAGKVPKNVRIKDPEERLNTLLAEYKHLVLTRDFSYKNEKVAAFVKNIKETHPQEELKVYNISLDVKLKKIAQERFGPDLPLFFIGGELQKQ